MEHEEQWVRLIPGDIMVLHATGPWKGHNQGAMPRGIIGIGVVGGTDRKTTMEWLTEITENRNEWPLLIHFSEIWWFGRVRDIRDEEIVQKQPKGSEYVTTDIASLVDRCVTFGDMDEAGFRMSAQGSMSAIRADRRHVVSLLATRLPASTHMLLGTDSLGEHPFEGPTDEEPTAEDLSSVRTRIAASASSPATVLWETIAQIEQEARQRGPKYYTRTARAIERDRRVAQIVKERDKYQCQICGAEGFPKSGGGLYAEAHHNELVSDLGLDAPSNMICVCPTCHRVLHYGTPGTLASRRAGRS